MAIPVSVNLTSLEEEILVKNIMVLNDMGLILERFGPRSYLIRSLPAGQKSLDGDMFKDLLAQLAEAGGKTEAREARGPAFGNDVLQAGSKGQYSFK